MKAYFSLALLSGILLFSCQKDFRGKKHGCHERCKGNEICTTDYRTLQLRVVDNLGNPVKLESFYTLQNRTGWTNEKEQICIGDCPGTEDGYYPYWSDAMVKRTLQEGEKVTFVGFMDGKQVVSKTLGVSFDCCHVVPAEDMPVAEVSDPKP